MGSRNSELLHRCYGEEGSKHHVRLQESLWRDVGPETQCGTFALCCRHQAVRHFCISRMVAWLSDGLRQEETKQGSKIRLGITGAMRTTTTNAIEALICLSHWTWWSRARVGQLRIDAGVWYVGLTYIPIEDIAVFCYGFSSQIPDSTWVLTL